MRIVVMLIAIAVLPLGAALAQTQAPQAQAPQGQAAQTQAIQPPKIAPEYQEAAAKRAAERKKLADCQKAAQEQKLLPRYATKFLADCLDK